MLYGNSSAWIATNVISAKLRNQCLCKYGKNKLATASNFHIYPRGTKKPDFNDSFKSSVIFKPFIQPMNRITCAFK